MTSRPLFPARIVAQLCYPVVAMVLAGIYRSGPAALDGYLLVSALYLALPHVLVAGVGFWPAVRRSTLLRTLVALNVLATAFCVALAISDDPNAGLCLVFYLPAWVAVLVLAPLIAVDTRYR